MCVGGGRVGSGLFSRQNGRVGYVLRFGVFVMCMCIFVVINKYMEGFGLVLDWFWSCVVLCGCWSTGELDLKCGYGEIEF